MVKVRKTPAKCDNKKMDAPTATTTVERRKSNNGAVSNNGLRRSRSVRQSLKQIGSRWLQSRHPTSDAAASASSNPNRSLNASKSLSTSNIYYESKENRFGADFENAIRLRNVDRCDFLSERNKFLYEKHTKVENKNHHHHHLLNFLSKHKKHDAKSDFVEPIPENVPPKAALLLQIPISASDEADVAKQTQQRDAKCGGQTAAADVEFSRAFQRSTASSTENGKANSNGGFIRNSMRLSTKRKSTLWSSSTAYSVSTSKLQTIDVIEAGSGVETTSNSGVVAAPFDAQAPAALPPTGTGAKHSKKQAKLLQQRLERLARVNIHLHALFAAIEHGHLEKARTILESTDVDVNSVNSDGLSPLDVAVLSNNRPLAKMLVGFGAREGNQFSNIESLNKHLTGLLNEAELRLQELSLGSCSNETPSAPRASFSSIMSSAYPSSAMTGCAGGGDNDKQIAVWGRRARSLQRLVLGLNQSRPPDPPQSVNLDITGTASVSITLREPVSQESPIITKYKVQWSTKSDFGCLCGEREILDLQHTTCLITDLNPGLKYYFRASCGNLKGFGNYRLSTPTSVIPSSWRDVENKDSRFSGQLKLLDELFTKVRQARPCDATELPSLAPATGNARRNQKKKTTIKQLFTAASKFQKHLRRGVFLACILYHEDKVLVTNEDFLPVVEVDETYPSCINTDFHWLMKVACTWDDVKSLRTDMEKNSTSAIHFRTKLLAAASQMQSALCIQDLGQVFHKPLKDSSGTVVISTVNYIKTPKSVSILNSRWLPLNKVHKKLNVLSEEHNVGEILMGSIQEQITYHQLSGVRLGKGLYLGYLKMQSSVELIQVVVPAKTPNVLPHCKVRDNSHVSAEEWQYLKTYSQLQFDSSTLNIELSCSEQQRAFIDQIRAALKRLFQYMDLGPEDILTHRIYDLEVIEFASDVSFVVVCPSAEMSCCVPGQREILLQRGDLLSLPVQAFEMIHLNTYQSNIIQRYARISCVLELDTIVANHVLREAFSSSELSAAKEQLAKLSDLQTGLNSVWKTVRWLMDVIAFARDRSSEQGIVMKQLLDLNDADCSAGGGQTTNGLKRTLLQIPPRDSKIVKSSPSRGSWPGPGVSNNGGINGTLSSEFSKSEQHLSIVPHDGSSLNLSSHYLSATSDNESTRKSSLESYRSKESVRYFLSDEMSNSRLPPSRSENTLVLSHRPLQQKQRSRSSIVVTSVSATTSPILNARPMYSGSLLSVNTVNTTTTSESVHSLSSDSDGTSCPIPIGSSTPSKLKKGSSKSVGSKSSRKSNFVEPKIKIDCTALHPDMNFLSSNYTNLESTTSKSLTNIRSDLNEARANFLKPTYLKSTLQDTMKRTDIMSSQDGQQQPFKTPYSVSKGDACAGTSLPDPMSEPSSPQPGILQVYAAYETGLASGTSLKLRVSPRTTAREVVDLVVKQLNMAVVLKGKEGPIYPPEKLQNFCLVAVIGARERCLRDDFKPLQLQNPWKKGRLYVRQKQDVLAAIEHSSKHSTVL